MEEVKDNILLIVCPICGEMMHFVEGGKYNEEYLSNDGLHVYEFAIILECFTKKHRVELEFTKRGGGEWKYYRHYVMSDTDGDGGWDYYKTEVSENTDTFFAHKSQAHRKVMQEYNKMLLEEARERLIEARGKLARDEQELLDAYRNKNIEKLLTLVTKRINSNVFGKDCY